MANWLTCTRIICSILLLFCHPLSASFYVIYLLAGFTDMIDGTVARKTGTSSEFGAKLDTIADIVLALYPFDFSDATKKTKRFYELLAISNL